MTIRKVFITGIGGFIGLRLAERLQERGAEVWGIDHSQDAVNRARDIGLRAELGDVTAADNVRKQLAGADVVIHTAAIVREDGKLEDFRRINVGGSRIVAEAAKEQGARCFVHFSSVMVYGFTFPDQVTEIGPLNGDDNPYCQTKIESERAVLELGNSDFGVIVIRPGDVYGPGCFPWVGRPVQMLKKRQLLLPERGNGKINYVYVDNLVDGILLAVEAEAYGETFNITDGAAIRFGDFYGRLAEIARLPRPLGVPTSVMRVIVSVISGLRRWGLTKMDVTMETVRMLSRPHAYSIEKAQRLLGYRPQIDLEQGLERTRPYIEQSAAQSG